MPTTSQEEENLLARPRCVRKRRPRRCGRIRNRNNCRNARGCRWNRSRNFCRKIRSLDLDTEDYDFDFYDEEEEGTLSRVQLKLVKTYFYKLIARVKCCAIFDCNDCCHSFHLFYQHLHHVLAKSPTSYQLYLPWKDLYISLSSLQAQNF